MNVPRARSPALALATNRRAVTYMQILHKDYAFNPAGYVLSKGNEGLLNSREYQEWARTLVGQ